MTRLKDFVFCQPRLFPSLLALWIGVVFYLEQQKTQESAKENVHYKKENGIKYEFLQQLDQRGDEEMATAIERRSFLTGSLLELVNKWESSSITAAQARHTLWHDIISQPGYIQHHPLHRIVFIKTHKTGSSTITSVFRSIATAHNLTTPITSDRHGRQFTPQKFEEMNIMNLNTTNPIINSAPYDIWCHHVVYDNLLTSHVVPAGRVVTVVRDPATRVRSACQYYGCCPSKFRDPSVFDNFVLSEKGEAFFGPETRGHCRVDQSSHEIVGTGLYPEKSFDENFEAVLEKAADGDFLILVTERMTESMLMLWHYFQLHPLDVAFLSKKVILSKFNNISNNTDNAERKLRDWNQYDTRIHDVANELLTQYMNSIFPGQQKQIQDQMEALNDLLFHVCSVFKEKTNDIPNELSDLSYWCREKEMDEVEWNEVHLEILKKHRTVPMTS